VHEPKEVKVEPDEMRNVSQMGSNPLSILVGQCPFCNFCLDPLMYRLQPNLLHMHIVTKHADDNPLMANLSSLFINGQQNQSKTTEEIPLDLSHGQPNPSFLPPGLLTQFGALNASKQPSLNFPLMNISRNESPVTDVSRLDERAGPFSGLMFNVGPDKAASGCNSSPLNQQTRRNRTSISNFQSKCMTAIYEYHKTPSVQECDRLGEFIGLSRRVVQVWFQNQRAKEKKMARVIQSNKLASPQQLANQNALNLCTPTSCLVCQVHFNSFTSSPTTYDEASLSSKNDRRLVEHLFTGEHLNNLIALYAKETKTNPNQSMGPFTNQLHSPSEELDEDSASH
ncbi:Zinc finger homeobox protein 3, partial [Cichlidogyrus casuarinus]